MKIGKHKIGTVTVLRVISQVLFFVFLPALYVSAFSGIQAIYMGIVGHSFDFAKLLPQLIEVIAIIPITLLLGRFFCGWMCAFGAMGDFIYFLSRKITGRKFKINEKADAVLKYLKYIWLIFLIVAVWTLNINIFSAANPWDAFGMLLTPGSLPNFSYVFSNLLPAFLILLLIIAGSFFVERFFCRYLCPLGALFSIFSRLRLTSVEKPKEQCGNCRVCTNSCPMGISLYKMDSSKSGECINCYRCVETCPRKNVRPAVSGGDIRPAVAGTMAVGVMAGVFYAGSFAAKAIDANQSSQAAVSDTVKESSSSSESSVAEIIPDSSSENNSNSSAATQPASSAAQSASSSADSASSQYKDGTYTGSGNGFRGGVTTVSVTVKSGKISDIQVVSSGDTPQFFERAFSAVVSDILRNQSAQVDAVSGATYSSVGIMDAVANALSKA